MTTREWNKAIDYLTNGEEGDWAEHNSRYVEIVSMCGGRYLLYNEEEGGLEFAGITNEAWRAVSFLHQGRF